MYIYMAKTRKKIVGGGRPPKWCQKCHRSRGNLVSHRGRHSLEPKTSKKKPTIFKKTTSWTKSARSGVPWEPRSSGERVIRHPEIFRKVKKNWNTPGKRWIDTKKQAAEILCTATHLNNRISKIIFGKEGMIKRKDYEQKSAGAQCKKMLGDPTTGRYDCWLCGCQLYPWMWGPNSPEKEKFKEHWNKYRPDCEHILPIFRAIFFSGIYEIKQISSRNKIDKKAASTAVRRRVMMNYLWAHGRCNRTKLSTVLIEFNKKQNKFQPDRHACDNLAGKIGEKLRLVSRGGTMTDCCPPGISGKGVCYDRARGGASKEYQNEMERQLVAINIEYRDPKTFKGNIQKFANYAIACIQLYAKDDSDLYKALDKRGGYKARKKIRSQSGGGYSCIDPEKLENFKNASQAWLLELQAEAERYNNPAAYYQLQIQYLLEKYNKDNNALENRFSDRDQIFNIIWSLYQSDPCISFGIGVELVNLMTIYFIGTKYGSENINGELPGCDLHISNVQGIQQKDIPLFKYMCNELRIIYSKYDSCTSRSEAFDSSRLPELVPFRNKLDDIFLSLAIGPEWTSYFNGDKQLAVASLANTPQLFYLVQRYLFDEGGLANWWRSNPRTPDTDESGGGDMMGDSGGGGGGTTMMDTQGGGLRRRRRRRKTRRQKNRRYSNRKRNTRRRKKFRR